MTILELVAEPAADAQSPFDAIKQTREDGSEFWSARDMMRLMGYSAWKNFEAPLERSMKSAGNQKMDLNSNFSGYRKVSQAGPPQQDYELSRFAAYLVAMNGDPNKPEVAAAQGYFALQTGFAERVQSNPELLAKLTTTESAPYPLPSAYEVGTLFSETMDEFKRVITPATVDTPAAHALTHTMQTWAQVMAHQIIGNPLMQGAPNVEYANVTEALPSVGKGDGEGVGVSPTRLPSIPITAAVEDPITWDEYARTEGIPRCGPCAGGLSSRIKHFAVGNGYPRGRTVLGHNVFPRALWKKFYEEWGSFYTALHNDPARNHTGDRA